MLDDRIIEAAVQKALARLGALQEQAEGRRTGLERELSLIGTRITHLLEAVKQGKGTASLLGSLQAEEDRRAGVLRDLAGLEGLAKVASLDIKRMAQRLRARATDIRGLLGRHIPQARQMLRKLITGRLVCEPFDEEGQRGYLFKGTGTYGPLFSGIECANDGRIPLGPPPC